MMAGLIRPGGTPKSNAQPKDAKSFRCDSWV